MLGLVVWLYVDVPVLLFLSSGSFMVIDRVGGCRGRVLEVSSLAMSGFVCGWLLQGLVYATGGRTWSMPLGEWCGVFSGEVLDGSFDYSGLVWLEGFQWQGVVRKKGDPSGVGWSF